MPRIALFFALFLLAACESPPAPTHPEMQGGGVYRNLATVPERPRVSVPIYERMKIEDELKRENAAAGAIQRESGFPAAAPELPVDKPPLPRELPE